MPKATANLDHTGDLIPAGEYKVRITDVRENTIGEKKTWFCDTEIVDGDYEGSDSLSIILTWPNDSHTGKGRQFLLHLIRQVYRACGLIEEGKEYGDAEWSSDDLIGKTILVDAEVSVWNGKERMKILDCYALDVERKEKPGGRQQAPVAADGEDPIPF